MPSSIDVRPLPRPLNGLPPAVTEFVRYGIVSALGLLLDCSLLYYLSRISGWSYLHAAAVGFTAGLALVYLLSIHWVFAMRSERRRLQEFLIFALIGLCGLTLNEFALWLGTGVLHMDLSVSKLASTTCVFIFNFALRKAVLFSGSPQ